MNYSTKPKDGLIRLAKTEDILQLLEIYAAARRFMRRSGNPVQWSPNHPTKEELERDIADSCLYVIKSKTNSNRICGCFVLVQGNDSTYDCIHNGVWRDGSPYCAIHRVASDGSEKGVFSRCTEFAKSICPHLRIDTHRDNIPMQNAILNQGFCYCGIIFLETGAQRLAYELCSEK